MSSLSLILKFTKYILFVVALFLLYHTVLLMINLILINDYTCLFDYIVSVFVIFYLAMLISYYILRKIVLEDTVLESIIWVVLANGLGLVLVYLIVNHVIVPIEKMPFEIPEVMFKEVNRPHNFKREINISASKMAFSFYSVFTLMILVLIHISRRLYQYKDLITVKNIFKNDIER